MTAEPAPGVGVGGVGIGQLPPPLCPLWPSGLRMAPTTSLDPWGSNRAAETLKVARMWGALPTGAGRRPQTPVPGRGWWPLLCHALRSHLHLGASAVRQPPPLTSGAIKGAGLRIACCDAGSFPTQVQAVSPASRQAEGRLCPSSTPARGKRQRPTRLRRSKVPPPFSLSPLLPCPWGWGLSPLPLKPPGPRASHPSPPSPAEASPGLLIHSCTPGAAAAPSPTQAGIPPLSALGCGASLSAAGLRC